MEPTIKYENCEDLFVEPTDIHGPNFTGQKRHLDYGGGVASECDGVGNGHYNMQSTGFIPPQNQDYCSQPQNSPAAQPTKRLRRGESTVLFSPPFFELPEENQNNTGDAFLARCVSCQVMLRGHKNVSSNFIKHMKRQHPHVHKMYENYKLMKQHGFGLGAQNIGGGFGMNLDFQGNKPTSATAADAIGGESSYFDANSFLETIQTTEMQSNSTTNTATATITGRGNKSQSADTTDNNFDEADPTDSANEYSNDSQQRNNIQAKPANTQKSEISLSSQTLQAMSRLFDEKLKSFATRNELTEVTKNIMNHVRSRQTTPCSSTTALDYEEEDENGEGEEKKVEGGVKYSNMAKELQDMRKRLEQSEQSKRILQRELHLLEKVVRKRKLIISNIPIAANQQPRAAVEQLFGERFNMPNVILENVCVITNRNRQSNNDRHTLLVEVAHENDVNNIFRKSACLRNTGIFIESQMSQISIKRKEKLLVLRREMLRRNSSLRILVRNTHLLVCDTYFHWDDLLGLCVGNLDLSENVLVSGDEAAEELRKLTNLDMKEFLHVLKNYDIR